VTEEISERVKAAAALNPDLPEHWLRGLAHNSAAPISVVRRLAKARDRLDYGWLNGYSAEVMAELATDADAEVRRRVAENPTTSTETMARLARDPDTRVRRAAVVYATHRGLTFPAEVVALIAEDEDRIVRCEAEVQQYRLRVASASEAEADPDPSPPEPVAPVPAMSAAEAESLIADPYPLVRAAAAENPQVPRELALSLADDPDDGVRLRLSLREDLSDEERQSIPYIVSDGYPWTPQWIANLKDDPDALIRLASSSHILIRRSVASMTHLPPQAVALLADDEDFFVKLTLCQKCADAPHELLMEMWAWWHGKTQWFLQFHPNFYRPGFAKYSTHPRPWLRALSFRDPELSVAEVVRLTADPKVYGLAISDLRLPMADLEAALVAGAASGASAAANPKLPPAVMHLLLDLAAVPQDSDEAPTAP
jgi:hypothetical protein